MRAAMNMLAASPLPPSQDLGHGLHCIDTLQERPGLACCYFLQRDGEGAFVEAGTSTGVPRLLAWLDARGIARASVRYVIVTHVHLDHAGGAGALLRELPNAKLVVHPRGARHLIDPSKLVAGATAVYGADAVQRMYGEIPPIPEARVLTPGDGETLPLGQDRLRFIDTPGHARHHFCIWDERSRGFFTGDTFGLSYREFDTPAGAWLMPTTTPVQFEPEAWQQTLDRLMAFAPQCLYLTHYGRVSDVPRLAAELRRGLERYVALARTLAGTEDRHARIRNALMDDAVADLRAHGSTLAETEARALLEFDIELNAQGLGVWLDRPGG